MEKCLFQLLNIEKSVIIAVLITFKQLVVKQIKSYDEAKKEKKILDEVKNCNANLHFNSNESENLYLNSISLVVNTH